MSAVVRPAGGDGACGGGADAASGAAGAGAAAAGAAAAEPSESTSAVSRHASSGRHGHRLSKRVVIGPPWTRLDMLSAAVTLATADLPRNSAGETLHVRARHRRPAAVVEDRKSVV